MSPSGSSKRTNTLNSVINGISAVSQLHLPADERLFTPFSLVDLHLEDLPELLDGISMSSLWKNLFSTHLPCLALVPDGPSSSGMLLSLTKVRSSDSELLQFLRSRVGRKCHYVFMYIYYLLLLSTFRCRGDVYVLYTIEISNASHTVRTLTNINKYSCVSRGAGANFFH